MRDARGRPEMQLEDDDLSSCRSFVPQWRLLLIHALNGGGYIRTPGYIYSICSPHLYLPPPRQPIGWAGAPAALCHVSICRRFAAAAGWARRDRSCDVAARTRLVWAVVWVVGVVWIWFGMLLDVWTSGRLDVLDLLDRALVLGPVVSVLYCTYCTHLS